MAVRTLAETRQAADLRVAQCVATFSVGHVDYPQDWRLKQREGGADDAHEDEGTWQQMVAWHGTTPEQMGTQASPRMPKTGHISVDGPSGARTTSVEDSGDR